MIFMNMMNILNTMKIGNIIVQVDFQAMVCPLGPCFFSESLGCSSFSQVTLARPGRASVGQHWITRLSGLPETDWNRQPHNCNLAAKCDGAQDQN